MTKHEAAELKPRCAMPKKDKKRRALGPESMTRMLKIK
jgi:hypothetical protein